MRNKNNIMLRFLTMASFVVAPIQCYGSDVELEENNSAPSYFSLTYWWPSTSVNEEHKEDSVTNLEVTNTETQVPIKESVEELLAQYGLSQSVIGNVRNAIDNHVSLSPYFNEDDLVLKNQKIGAQTVSLYGGAIYDVVYGGEGISLTALELKDWAVNLQRDAKLVSIKKDGEIIFSNSTDLTMTLPVQGIIFPDSDIIRNNDFVDNSNITPITCDNPAILEIDCITPEEKATLDQLRYVFNYHKKVTKSLSYMNLTSEREDEIIVAALDLMKKSPKTYPHPNTSPLGAVLN